MTGLFVGTPISDLPVATTLSDTASVLVVDNGAKLATLTLLGAYIGASAIINADIISPAYLEDYIPIIRDGVIYLATVADILAASPIPTPPPENPYVAEDGTTYYVAEDGVTYYEAEFTAVGMTGQPLGLLLALTHAS